MVTVVRPDWEVQLWSLVRRIEARQLGLTEETAERNDMETQEVIDLVYTALIEARDREA